MKTGNLIAGVVGGLAVGAILGVLFAPDKGANTRRKILKRAEKAKEDLKDGFDDYLDTLSEKYNALVKTGEELLDKGKEELKTIEGKVNP
jgi:gas vesicle protein